MNKLFELFKFCGDNRIDFTYETDEKGINQITHFFNENEKHVNVKVCDPKDENLDKLIDEKIKELSSILC